MKQSTVTIRLDNDIKMQFDKLCESFGMSVNTAFNIFVRAVIQKRKIPFTIEASTDNPAEIGRTAFEELRTSARMNGLAGMSDEDIIKEIADYRSGK